jgi:hypothetical protein
MRDGTIKRRGGAIVNGLRLTWPLATLKITRSSLRMQTFFGGDFELAAGDITLKKKWRHLWPGIQIEHARPDLPRDLFFMPLYRPRLVRALTQLGYRVL